MTNDKIQMTNEVPIPNDKCQKQEVFYDLVKKIILIGIGVTLIILTGVFWRLWHTTLPPNEEVAQQNKKAVQQHEVFIAPAWSMPKNSRPGDEGLLDSMDILKRAGINLFYFSSPWSRIEPSKGKLDLKELFKPFKLVAPKYPEFKGIFYVLGMINTGIREMPEDLAKKPFDDPEVLSRLDAMIDAIAKEPYADRLTHILLGNEVDGYFAARPEELKAFSAFYQRGVKRIHEKMPWVKVSTILTAAGVEQFPQIFDELTKHSDFIDYTYYPVESLRRGNIAVGWQMKPVSEIAADLEFLAGRAEKAGKPFAFTEIGYAASGKNNSSEDKQLKFVKEMFRALDPYRQKGQIEFLLYSTMYDYATGSCRPYGQVQGVPDIENLCSFMESLGLRSFLTGEPRKAWDVFSEGARSWTSGSDLPAGWEVDPYAEERKEKPQRTAASGTFQSKLQKIHSELPKWVEQNPDGPQKIAPLLQKLDQYQRDKNFQEAERVADEILRLIGK